MAPCLRKDLVATTADEQGIACVEVTDPVSGVSFRFYDFEYALAQQLTGQPTDGVIEWARATYAIDLSNEALDLFVQKLDGLGFLAPPVSSPVPAEPFALLPRLEVLAAPLPPVVAPEPGPAAVLVPAAAPWPVATDHAKSAGRSAPVSPAFDVATALSSPRPSAPPLSPPPGGSTAGVSIFGAPAGDIVPRAPARGGGAASGKSFLSKNDASDTPLGSIARAIAESTAPPPAGALDVGLVGGAPIPRDVTGPAPDGSRDAHPVAFADEGQPANLGDQSDPVPGDRRQPPPPEVVVMPPMAAPPAPAPSPRRGRAAFLALLLVGGGMGAAVWFLRPSEAPPVPQSSSEAAPRVHVVSPQPTTFYLWFDEIGTVAPPREDTLAFRVGGRVQDAMPPGATFSVGDAIARLQGVAARELAVNRLRSRVAFFEQLRDSSRAEGSEAAARQADIKLAARKLELAAAQAALAELEIRPKVPGEIAQVLVQKGDLVKGGDAAFHVRSTWPRATFAFSAEDAARLQELGFCRIETVAVAGTGGDTGTAQSKVRTIDCVASTPTAAPGVAPEPLVAVDLIGETGVTAGTRVRLASARYDGVFPVPQSCVLREGDVDHVWVVSGGGRFAERRTVERVATVDTTELVAHGIAVGDAVVVDPPATLKAGSEIEVVR